VCLHRFCQAAKAAGQEEHITPASGQVVVWACYHIDGCCVANTTAVQDATKLPACTCSHVLALPSVLHNAQLPNTHIPAHSPVFPYVGLPARQHYAPAIGQCNPITAQTANPYSCVTSCSYHLVAYSSDRPMHHHHQPVHSPDSSQCCCQPSQVVRVVCFQNESQGHRKQQTNTGSMTSSRGSKVLG
jgi:hypothetical protein